MNDPKNKRTFKKFGIEEFLVMDVQDSTQMFVDTYGEHLGFTEKESADLQEAFESGENGVIYMYAENRRRMLLNELPEKSKIARSSCTITFCIYKGIFSIVYSTWIQSSYLSFRLELVCSCCFHLALQLYMKYST